MNLGDIVKQYRTAQGLSQRAFALRSGLSNSYVSMIENNMNPKTCQPIIPSLIVIRKVANTMGVTIDDILRQMDDVDVSLSADDCSSPMLDELDAEILDLLHMLPDAKKHSFVDLLRSVVDGEARK